MGAETTFRVRQVILAQEREVHDVTTIGAVLQSVDGSNWDEVWVSSPTLLHHIPTNSYWMVED